MITSVTPDDWQDLQDEVGEILDQCGFEVEVEKTLPLARGKAELDVFAKEVVSGREYSIACECKHWSRAVPQEVIHSFRTVVADMGANVGYIISTEGFQSGSISASQLTNIELVTWEEFQSMFFETWFENYFVETITEELDPLMTYTEPLPPKWFSDLTEEGKEDFKRLRKRYEIFGMVIMSMFSSYSRMLGDDKIPSLPLKDRIDEPDSDDVAIPDPILEARGYRQLLDLSLKFGRQGIKQFRSVKTEKKKL